MDQPKIMIVEDSRSNQVYLAELLHLHYRIQVCSTGEEALEQAGAFGPDIILLDIVLPGMDGYEVCKRLRADPDLAHTKIIFLTSQKSTVERLTSYLSGAEDYMTKPFNGDELLAKIRVFLRLKSAEEVARKMQIAYKQTVASLVRAMEAKDAYTSGHSERVAAYACLLGHTVGLGPRDLQRLEWAGLVHDIGKIGIPDTILLKPGRLTDDEFEQIREHPVKSFKVLEPIDALRDIVPAVKYHHEHYDGSGYPEGLQGEEIPFLARVLQIADIWDALTTSRPYRQAMSFHQARQVMIREAGTIMDPNLVTRFLDAVRQYRQAACDSDAPATPPDLPQEPRTPEAQKPAAPE